uniref:Uncharacterized protein n=1 Tax=Meloidogyne enterolobii TaxID=390850 RepID=A0A6V7WB84_MELEN|nr:unnamed protein product [Meloidogyne enterolobii]
MLKTIFILFLIYSSTNSNPISTEAYTNEDFLFPNRYKREEPKTCSKCPLTINGVSTLMSTAISGFQSGAAQLCSLNTTTEENCVETTNNIAGILRQVFSIFPELNRGSPDLACQLLIKSCPQKNKEGQIVQGLSCTNCVNLINYILNNIEKAFTIVNSHIKELICSTIREHSQRNECYKKFENVLMFTDEFKSLVEKKESSEQLCSVFGCL